MMKRKIGLDVGDKTVGIAVSDPLGITAQGLMTLERVGIRKDTGKILDLVKECFAFIRDFRGEVPGASAKDCGNYLDMNLPMANYWGERYSALLENITPDRLVYPE